MSNSTAAASDSDGYSNISHGLSSVPINNLMLILGSTVLLSVILYIAWQFSTRKGSEVSVTNPPKDCENAKDEKPPLPQRKSVRFSEYSEELSEAHETPQMVPIPQVTLAVGSDCEDAISEEKRSPRKSRAASVVSNLFRNLSRSMSLFSLKSEDLDEDDDFSHTPSPPSDDLTDLSENFMISEEISTPPESPQSLVDEHRVACSSPQCSRNRIQSEPIKIQSDENGFYVGEEVQYRGKARWKRGVVTSINPLKVQGDGNFRARQYEQVRKLRKLPSKIGEEVDDMDVEEMDFDDFKRLMRSARQNTRTGRDLLADTAKSQSLLVETITRNQK